MFCFFFYCCEAAKHPHNVHDNCSGWDVGFVRGLAEMVLLREAAPVKQRVAMATVGGEGGGRVWW